ncbi:MAG: sialate O-acetylesterase [Candidatus Methylacidiphilales bacterium]|nr:sialate O-acetylesterase [Candidatus Methylacidiphilales bacterium]
MQHSFLPTSWRRFLILPVATATAATCLGLLPAARADVVLPSILSRHAVLQKSPATRVWGKAAPGEKIKISLGTQQAEATAGDDGRWQTTLDLRTVGEGPFELVVEGNNRVVVPDIVVGEVWICSGQSNMAYKLERCQEGPAEVPKSASTRLRHFRIPLNPMPDPVGEVKGSWIVADPTTSGEFTAVGYFFGKKVSDHMKTPVGLILSGWAGTSIISWLPPNEIQKTPDLKAKYDSVLKTVAEFDERKKAYLPAYHQWEEQNQRTDRGTAADHLALAAVEDTNGWKKITLPARTLSTEGLPDAGATWLRRSFELPPGDYDKGGANSSAFVHLGSLRDYNEAYINGKLVGETTPESMKGTFDIRYTIPSSTLKPGQNSIAIRLRTPSEKAGAPGSMYVAAGTARALLTGEWMAKSEYELPALDDKLRAALPQMPQSPGSMGVPGRLYNGMIAPLIPVSIAGVVWYQGEQDTGNPDRYWPMLQAMIQGWRRAWGSEIPFMICQLPNNGQKVDKPLSSTWATLREAQAKADTLPATGVAVTVDVGEEDVHPPAKQPVGERLALLALARVYKQALEDSGPVYKSFTVVGETIEIEFNHAEGLAAKELPREYQPTSMSTAMKPLPRLAPEGSELEGFEIRGEDKQWHFASATIRGNVVVVSSPKVTKPVAARYGWANNPTCNLTNTAGLPARPFRTDAP